MQQFIKSVNKQLEKNQAYTNSVFSNENYDGYVLIKDNYFYHTYIQISENNILMSGSCRTFLNVCFGDVLTIIKTTPPDYISEVVLKFKKINTINKIEISLLRDVLNHIPLISGFLYNIKTDFSYQVEVITQNLNGQLINENTAITVIDSDGKIITDQNEGKVFKGKFNFKELSIGGLDKEFIEIFRRAFSTRLLSQKIRKEQGIRDVRGIMLHGPPGCGKTLIARQLSKAINAKSVKVVQGPSLIDGLIGKSEQNVRELFTDAEQDWISNPDTNNIYVIILDECEVIFKKRGSGSGVSGEVSDNMVTQFLSKIDGVDAIGNILLICMTNRIDQIDSALLRPGRIELHLEIKLPDINGRREILNIHLDKIKNKEEIDIEQLAEMTSNFTGAEIEGCVQNANTYSISRIIDPDNLKEDYSDEIIILKQKDLELSIMETIPQYGNKSEILKIILSKEFNPFGGFELICERMATSEKGNVNSFLFWGDGGQETLCVCNAANISEQGLVRFINAEMLLGFRNKAEELNNIIQDCLRSESTTIILDHLELLVEYSKFNNYCNGQILLVIKCLLDKKIENHKKVNVVITTKTLEFTELLELESFDYQYHIG